MKVGLQQRKQPVDPAFFFFFLISAVCLLLCVAN